jgi:hypothetical protein
VGKGGVQVKPVAFTLLALLASTGATYGQSDLERNSLKGISSITVSVRVTGDRSGASNQFKNSLRLDPVTIQNEVELRLQQAGLAISRSVGPILLVVDVVVGQYGSALIRILLMESALV